MRISGAESVVMEALWRKSPLSAEEVAAEVAAEQRWSETTVKTLLNRLLKKKAVRAVRAGRRYLYSPLVARAAYVQDESRGLIDRLSGLSRVRMRNMVDGAWSHDWEHDPFARGAYSYQGIDGVGAPRDLARSLRGTLFFAGEAADLDGRTGTVHGAIAGGQRAAGEVERVLSSATAISRAPRDASG